MGVVTGIVMPFQFGTNWSDLSDAAGNIIGPLLAYEGLTAFFSRRRFLACCCSAVPWCRPGRILSLPLWSRSARSFPLLDPRRQQLDADASRLHHRRRRFYPVDWLQIVFSPSFPYRFAHTVVAFYVTTGFVVLGVGAYTIRRGLFHDEGRVMMATALALLAVLVPLQMFIGDQHGLNTRRYQPAKLAGIEALWNTVPRCRLPCSRFPIRAESETTMRSRCRFLVVSF